MTGSEDPPFETHADVIYDVIQLLKVLVEEKNWRNTRKINVFKQ